MVEFRKKSVVVQDTTLDEMNPDLYDGGSGYVLVGDKVEPKIGLFRFQISEKPNFGDAELKYGTMGFYNLSTSSNSGSNLPHFSLYKMIFENDTAPAEGLQKLAGSQYQGIPPIKKVIGQYAESAG